MGRGRSTGDITRIVPLPERVNRYQREGVSWIALRRCCGGCNRCCPWLLCGGQQHPAPAVGAGRCSPRGGMLRRPALHHEPRCGRMSASVTKGVASSTRPNGAPLPRRGSSRCLHASIPFPSRTSILEDNPDRGQPVMGKLEPATRQARASPVPREVPGCNPRGSQSATPPGPAGAFPCPRHAALPRKSPQIRPLRGPLGTARRLYWGPMTLAHRRPGALRVEPFVLRAVDERLKERECLFPHTRRRF